MNEENAILISGHPPLDPKLRKNLDSLKTLIDNNQAALIVVDGPVGVGKTTGAALMAAHIQEDFDVKKQIGRGAEQFLKAFEMCVEMDRPYVCCVYDEAGDFSKRGALTKLNKVLNQIFNTARQTRVILFLVLPRFYYLDSWLWDKGAVQFLVNFYGKVNNEYSKYRVYELNTIYYMSNLLKKNKVWIPPKVYTKAWPNFRGRVRAPNILFQEKVNTFSEEGKTALRKQALADQFGEDKPSTDSLLMQNRL